MSFKNKKILMLCKESYSYPLHFLAKKLQNSNKVAAYFFMPAECVYNKSLLNEITFFKFKELNNVKIYDSACIAHKFTKNLANPKVDYDYINAIENSYTKFKNLNLQLMSSQFTTNYYHNRNYYSDFSYEQQIYWLELNYKNAIRIIDEFKPDVIIDLDDSELPRTIINEIAYSRSIPYITLEHPRFEFYKYPTFKMGLGIDKYFLDYYNEFISNGDNTLSDEFDYIYKYNEKSGILPEEFKNTTTGQYDKEKSTQTFKKLLGKIIYFWNQDVSSDNLKEKNKNKLLYPGSIKYLQFYFSTELKKRLLFGKNKYFCDPVEGDNYVYMPLHLIPESTTFVKAPLYVNEMFIIEEVSKSLPVGWLLYVKEHQAMLGERSLDFYKKISRLPNVKVVSMNYYNDPKPWILNSKGVITISGSSALEAAFLGKKSLVFSDVPFSLIDGITRVRSFEELPKLIKEFQPIDNIKSCAAYIAAVKKSGIELKLKYLMSEGEQILLNRVEFSKEYADELNILEGFYFDAYNKYIEINNSENNFK